MGVLPLNLVIADNIFDSMPSSLNFFESMVLILLITRFWGSAFVPAGSFLCPFCASWDDAVFLDTPGATDAFESIFFCNVSSLLRICFLNYFKTINQLL